MTSSLYLNVGCGKVKIPGFVNIDREPGGDIQCDVTQGLPYSDNSVDGIYSGNFIERLKQSEIISFFRECRRVLKPGGRVRIATQDLDTIISQYMENKWRQPWLKKYGYDWIQNRAEYINISLREWGHSWVVNEEELTRLANWAGLENPCRTNINESIDSRLSNLETRTESTLIMEYSKSVPSSIDEPLVSIVIPAYRADFLAPCLASAISQTYKKIEILVLDDSKSDEVRRITQDFILRDSRVTYIKNQEPLGEAANLTKGIQLANGELIKPLYDDDFILPDTVKRLLVAFRSTPDARLAVVRRKPIDENGELLHGVQMPQITSESSRLRGTDIINHLLTTGVNFLGEPTCMLFNRRDALAINEQNVMSLFGYLCEGAGDVCLAIHLLSRGDLAYVDGYLARFRIHSNQTTQQKNLYTIGMNTWKYLREQGVRLGLVRP